MRQCRERLRVCATSFAPFLVRLYVLPMQPRQHFTHSRTHGFKRMHRANDKGKQAMGEDTSREMGVVQFLANRSKTHRTAPTAHTQFNPLSPIPQIPRYKTCDQVTSTTVAWSALKVSKAGQLNSVYCKNNTSPTGGTLVPDDNNCSCFNASCAFTAPSTYKYGAAVLFLYSLFSFPQMFVLQLVRRIYCPFTLQGRAVCPPFLLCSFFCFPLPSTRSNCRPFVLQRVVRLHRSGNLQVGACVPALFLGSFPTTPQ